MFSIFLIIVLVLESIWIFYLSNKNKQIIEFNFEQENKNKELLEQSNELIQSIKDKREELNTLQISIDRNDSLLNSYLQKLETLQQNSEVLAQEAYEKKLNFLISTIDEEVSENKIKLQKLLTQISSEEDKLSQLESKQAAYIQAQQRQEAIAANEDYYKLNIDELDLNDVKLLRDFQSHFIRKDSIDKLIWEVYYKPAYDILMSHYSSGKICGIYKITDSTTGQAYIGQSVDIKERWRQHIKTALSYGKASNKLYQAMQNSGVNNFIFEILEEVPRSQLNERETYWINFYQTKELGLNVTKGGS